MSERSTSEAAITAYISSSFMLCGSATETDLTCIQSKAMSCAANVTCQAHENFARRRESGLEVEYSKLSQPCEGDSTRVRSISVFWTTKKKLKRNHVHLSLSVFRNLAKNAFLQRVSKPFWIQLLCFVGWACSAPEFFLNTIPVRRPGFCQRAMKGMPLERQYFITGKCEALEPETHPMYKSSAQNLQEKNQTLEVQTP